MTKRTPRIIDRSEDLVATTGRASAIASAPAPFRKSSMNDLAVRSRTPLKARCHRPVRPILEALEARMLLYAANGDDFKFGSRITWSIIPDGTNLAGIASNLVSTMNQKLGAGNWLQPLEDAFAQWENLANVNFSQVSDNGAPLGSGNYQQGSPNFGDIRIGGLALPSNVLAVTYLPPKANGGSEAGDVFFNTSQPWHNGSDYDLETVAIHELGHDVGLGESTVVNAVMYPYYGGVQQSLASDDIAGVQSIWGPRQEDPFVQNFNNLSFAHAANVTGFMVSSSDQVFLPGLDVASQSDTYWFKVTTPANSSKVFTALVQSSGLSELSPRVAIFNSSDNGLVQTSAPANAYGTTITASITNATPNTIYYVRVTGSNSGDTGTGAYAMTLNMGPIGIATAPPPNTTVVAQPDQGGGAQQMTVGGVGTWIKEMGLGGLVPNLSSLGIQDDPLLSLSMTSLVTALSSYGILSNASFDSALAGLLQELPTGYVDGSLFESSSLSSYNGGSGPISVAQLNAILLPFFADVSVMIKLGSLLGGLRI
jgi:Matrixin